MHEHIIIMPKGKKHIFIHYSAAWSDVRRIIIIVYNNNIMYPFK